MIKFVGGIRMGKKAITGKRKSFWRWKQFLSAENKSRYFSGKKSMRDVVEAMNKEAVKEMEEIRNNKAVAFNAMRMLKKEAKD